MFWDPLSVALFLAPLRFFPICQEEEDSHTQTSGPRETGAVDNTDISNNTLAVTNSAAEMDELICNAIEVMNSDSISDNVDGADNILNRADIMPNTEAIMANTDAAAAIGEELTCDDSFLSTDTPTISFRRRRLSLVRIFYINSISDF